MHSLAMVLHCSLSAEQPFDHAACLKHMGVAVLPVQTRTPRRMRCVGNVAIHLEHAVLWVAVHLPDGRHMYSLLETGPRVTLSRRPQVDTFNFQLSTSCQGAPGRLLRMTFHVTAAVADDAQSCHTG